MAARQKAEPSSEQSEPSPHATPGSTDTAPPTGGEIAEAAQTRGVLMQANDAAMQSFIGWCTDRAQTTDEDQYNIMASIIGDIVRAGNVAELMAERAPLHARDIVGRPLILHGFEIREGDFEDSVIGFYAAMTCGRPGTDETRIVTCGAAKVMAKLMMLDHFINDPNNDESWPQIFWFTEKKMKSGNSVLDITRPEIVEG